MITCQFEDGGKAALRHVTVDCLVVKDDKLLMVLRAKRMLEGGKWALPGGFMDRDETLTETAAREIHEESGWEVTDLTLLTLRDKPDRTKDDRQCVSVVYIGKAIKQTGQPDDESDDVKWFPLSDLPDRDSIAFDHAEIIDLYQEYLAKDFDLPLLSQ